MFKSLQCPIDDCLFHFKIILAPISVLEEHLYHDHGYYTKKQYAEQLGIIPISQPGITARELSRKLAKEGIVNE